LLRARLNAGAEFVFPGEDDRLCTLTMGAHAGGDRLVVGLARPETGADLWALDLKALGSPPVPLTRLTRSNSELFSSRRSATYERVQFDNGDGQTVEGLVAVPPGLVPGRERAPLIVKIHGGPMAYDSPDFRFDVQYLAGLGYLVLMVNYRGSISYGEDFCQVIRGDWGPREHDDVMSGVEALVARGWADPDRLFCTGFSQGGIMTNWAVGHTDRFRAAVSEHGMWDYVSSFGTDDCHLWWQDDMGVPWQNPDQYRKTSPMSGVANINTPLLITAGELDWRCPLSQAEQLYVALKKRGVPAQLVIYQGERHAISKPRRAIDRIRRIAGWFARYGGQPWADDSAEGYPDPAQG
jgi:dipeptidyl aminopeptidase/acylaminoacyl peptidase